jgi:hypothetical protein
LAESLTERSSTWLPPDLSFCSINSASNKASVLPLPSYYSDHSFRYTFFFLTEVSGILAHLVAASDILKRAGAKALPLFQLIKEKRTRVQEYQIQITTPLSASNHPNAWPRQGSKALPQL